LTQNVNVRPGGTLKWYYDAATNDSDKTITVPAGKVWRLLSLELDISCTATVGNRILRTQIGNGTNVIFAGNDTTAITAAQVGAVRASAGGPQNVTTDGYVTLFGGGANVVSRWNLPVEMYLPAGYTIRLWDAAAIDAAADDIAISIHYIEYEA